MTQSFFRTLIILIALLATACVGNDSTSYEKSDNEAAVSSSKQKRDKSFLTLSLQAPAPDQCSFESKEAKKSVGGLEFTAKIIEGVDVSLEHGETVLLEDNVENIFRKLQGRSSIDMGESILLYRGEIDSKKVEVKNGNVELQREGECIYQVSLFIEVY